MPLILSSTWSADIDYKKTFNQYTLIKSVPKKKCSMEENQVKEYSTDTEIIMALGYSNRGSKIKKRTLVQLITEMNITLLSCLPWTVFYEESLLDTLFELARDNSDAKTRCVIERINDVIARRSDVIKINDVRKILLPLIKDSKPMLNSLLNIFPKVLANLILEYSSVSLQGMEDKINKLENRSNCFELLSFSIFHNNASVDLLQESAWLNFLGVKS